MRVKRILASGVALLLMVVGAQDLAAQWAAPYANNWLSYNQRYVKINVAKRGIHRVPFSSLPKDFVVGAPEKLQLWRRGKQVAILSTTNNEILFYALTNDGASDTLLYKPASARMNPYFSMYADEGAYFLTSAETNGLRAKVVNQQPDEKIPVVTVHNETVVRSFQTQYSLSTQYPIRAHFYNSYFEFGASRTGNIQLVGKTLANEFSLVNLNGDIKNVSIKLLVHGRSDNARNIEVYVGKDTTSLRLVRSIANTDFEGSEYTFNLQASDVDANNKGILALKTVSESSYDRFSLTYFSVNFPQAINTNGQVAKEFRLPPTSQSWSRFQFQGTINNVNILDVTDRDVPVIIKGSMSNLMVPRSAGKNLNLLTTGEVTTVAAEKMKLTEYNLHDPKATNYIIISTENLYEGALKYAEYRASKDGGGYKPLVVKITDIYDQFNYGEPSPVGIKKFMAYVIGQGGRDKYLFLIGKSITHNERMKRELPEEVPTVGYPASDMLLVEGFPGIPANVQAVPVGRLSATTNQHVADYLQKVKDYEHNVSGEYGWRKNVLHLNGGKNTGEITQLRNLLADLEPSVKTGVIGGKVTPFVKKQPMAEVEEVNITSNVNDGVGLITYFGHGSPTITDLDMGYITDAARGYNNAKKYPMMYFNGCGVGNVFSNRFSSNPNATDRMTLSLDWMLAPNRGTVAIIANSFESFVSPSSKYLQQLYKDMFVNPATTNLSIGKIQAAVAQTIVSENTDKYSIANVHQSVLQGDPALHLITVDKADYALNPLESISLYAKSADVNFESSDSIKVGVAIANKGRYIAGQRVPMEVSLLGNNGELLNKYTINAFPYQDTVYVNFKNNKDAKMLKVHIDPQHTISELDIQNNVAELELDWDEIKDRSSFTSASIKDIAPPILTVKFDGKQIVNNEAVAANPVISLTLTDDRQMFADTSLLDVFVKKCPDNTCDFKRIVYSVADIAIDSINNRTFMINYLSADLGAGEYELLVNTKDQSGNAGVQPYRIRFVITEEVQAAELTVSPNPASTYIRFNLKAKANFKAARYSIYNLAGVRVESKEKNFDTKSLTEEWYWLPTVQPSGLYIYKVEFLDANGNVAEQRTGKIAVTK